jgi:hypothetical protein
MALNGKQPDLPPRPPLLDGEQQAQVIALRLGSPLNGFANWSLRLLAEKVVELSIVEFTCHETVRRTLKKLHDAVQGSKLGDSSRGQR